MKNIILISQLLLVISMSNMQAQKVECKNGIVKVDSKDLLSYSITNRRYELTIYKLNTTTELVFLSYNDKQTPDYKSDDYYIINFLPLKLKMETHNWDAWEKTIKWFIESKLFDPNGELNEEKVKIFIEKYNENISEKRQ